MTLKQMLRLLAVATTVPLLSFGIGACQAPMPMSQNQPSSDHTLSGSSGMTHPMGSMDLGPKDADYDLRFIDAMTLHHQGGVDMAQDALRQSTRPEIKQLAQAIITAQEQEIAQLQEWRQTWYPDADAAPIMYDPQMGHMMPMSDAMRSTMMMTVDLGASDNEFDLRFMNAMIPHHAGALVMAQDVLEKSDRPPLQDLARNILTSQQQEINQLTQWRQQWYGQ